MLLLEPEALAVHDRQLEHVRHLARRGVLGQQQRVEARVRRRQLVAVGACLGGDEERGRCWGGGGWFV